MPVLQDYDSADLRRYFRSENLWVTCSYDLRNLSQTEKSEFNTKLYGRNKDGLIFKIPHIKLNRGVIAFPQRNFDEIEGVMDEFNVKHTCLPIIKPPIKEDKLTEYTGDIAKKIKDPYEIAVEGDSKEFGRFLLESDYSIPSFLKKLRKNEIENPKEWLLTISDTIKKWIKNHPKDEMIIPNLEVADALQSYSKLDDQEEILNKVETIRKIMMHQAIASEALSEASDDDTLEGILKIYGKKLRSLKSK